MENENHPSLCLEVRHLVKSYGGRRVVNGLSFKVGAGEIVGLLGPNGAGKTTAFYMTVGLIRPDEGRVLFPGERCDPASDAQKGPDGNGISRPGAVGLPQFDG